MPFRSGILFFNMKVLYVCQEIKVCFRNYLFVDISLLIVKLYTWFCFQAFVNYVRFVRKVIKWYMGVVYLVNCSRCQYQTSCCLKSVLWGMSYGFTVHWLPTDCFYFSLGVQEPDMFFILTWWMRTWNVFLCCSWVPNSLFATDQRLMIFFLMQKSFIELWFFLESNN